jgi:predicted DNA-binding transcriptional regulator AlpA
MNKKGYLTDQQLFYRPCHLHRLLGVSRQGLANMEKRGDLPPRISIAPGISGWTAEVIDEWLATRKEGRRKAATRGAA